MKMKINVAGPGSRLLTSEFLCLSKTLTSDEVDQGNPKLHFDPNDAVALTNSRPGTYSKDLMVFDEDDRQYTLNLSHDNTGGETSYCLDTGWRAFLRAHDLKEGDRIAFYRMKDVRVREDYYYYVVMYFRKPAHIVEYQFKKKPNRDDYDGQKDSISESEPNKETNAGVSPDNAACEGIKRSAQVPAGGSWVRNGGVTTTTLASLLELRLEAEIEEAERQVQYWGAKKSEAVGLLESCRVLANKAIYEISVLNN